MNLQPLGDRVVVKRIKEEQETESGIIIPESAQGTPNQAEVVAVGSGEKKNGDVVKPDVDEGDTVLIGEFSGSEIEVDGEEFVFLDGDQILAKIA
ncbi:MAG: co-chaperone GroES [bacterium]